MKTPAWIKIDVPQKIGRLGLMKGDNVYEKMSDGRIGKHAGLVVDPAHGKKVLCSWVDAPDTPEQMGVRQLMKASNVGRSIVHGGKRYVVRRYIPGGVEHEVFDEESSTEDENAEEEDENAEEEEENAEEEEENAEEEEENAEDEASTTQPSPTQPSPTQPSLTQPPLTQPGGKFRSGGGKCR